MEGNDPFQAAIAALNAQRPLLGDAAVDAAIATLRASAAPPAPPARPEQPQWSGERKLVTIMFADISGFTALSERMDPEEVRSLMNACFDRLVPVLEHYGGTVDKFIGDEIMALFGAPLAQENHAEQALLAALDMVAALDDLTARRNVPLALHFGINTGLVVAGDIGSANRQQYSVMGDAVNLAARLEDASERGEILVGPTTHRLCGSLFDFEPLPPIRVKGKAEPVAVYRLLGRKHDPASPRGIPGLRAPLVGRAAEQEQLRAAVRRAIAGQGGVVAIVGEPGLGKSRLVADTWNEFAGEMTWAEGRALAYTGGMTDWTARDMLRCLIGAGPNDTPAAAAVALRQTAESLFGERLAEVYPYLAQLAETPLEPEFADTVRQLSPEVLRRRMGAAFGQWVRALCARQPLALVWEDLHWADQSSLDLIETLLPLTTELPLLVLLVYRQVEGRIDEWRERATATCAGGSQLIALRRLSAEAGDALLSELLSDTLPEATRRLILDKAEGNPFFLEEVLRSLIDAGQMLIEGSHATAAKPIEQLDMPDTLHGVVAARIDRLPAEDKHVLQLAAVIGRVFQRAVLAHLQRLEPDDPALGHELTDLQRRELIRPRTDLEYIFKHAVMQEVTYNGLLLAQRRALHLAVAQAIEALFPDQTDELSATLAYHYRRAGSPANAVRYLLLAGDRAVATYANVEALAHFRAALEALESGQWATGEEERIAGLLAAHERLGDVLATAGDYDAARAAFAAGLSLTPPEARITAARWSRKTAQSYMRQRLFADAVTHLDAATVALDDVPGDESSDAPAWGRELGWVLLTRIYAAYWTANLALMTDLLGPAREAVMRHGDAVQRAELHRMQLTAAWQRKRFLMDDEVISIADAHLAAAREVGRLEPLAWALTMRGISALHYYPRQLDVAENYLRQGIATSEQAGSRDVLVVGRHWLAYTYRARGDVEAVDEHVAALLPLTDSAPFYRGGAYADLAWVALRRGDRGGAADYARRALATWEGGPPMARWMAQSILVVLAHDEGDTAAAVEFTRALISPGQMAIPAPLRERYLAAIADWEDGRSDAAREELARALQLSQALGYD